METSNDCDDACGSFGCDNSLCGCARFQREHVGNGRGFFRIFHGAKHSGAGKRISKHLCIRKYADGKYRLFYGGNVGR